MPLYYYEDEDGNIYEEFRKYEDRNDCPPGHRLLVSTPKLRVSGFSKRVANYDKFHEAVIKPRLEQAGTSNQRLRFGNTAGI